MNKRSKRWKFLLPLVIGMMIMSAAFVLISYITFRDVEIEDYENYAKGLTGLIADDIIKANDVDGFLRMGWKFPKYKETELKLYKLREAYPDVTYLYAYQAREDGLHVVFDLDTEQFKGSAPGTVEHFFPDLKPYIQDMLEGKEVPPILSHEEYGYVLTVMTPLYDSRGICKCYIGADCSMDQLTGYVWKIIRKVAYAFLIVFAAALIAAVVMTNISFKRMKKLENRAYIDTLTGLQNRTAFYENMGRLTKKIEAGNADFSTLMIDVNYLKKVNDVYGHEQGNAYLQNAANLIQRHFGNEGVYRIGGDEFAIKADESLQPWEKPSAAVGLAKYIPGEHDVPDAVLRRADEYMYADKVAMKAVRTD